MEKGIAAGDCRSLYRSLYRRTRQITQSIALDVSMKASLDIHFQSALSSQLAKRAVQILSDQLLLECQKIGRWYRPSMNMVNSMTDWLLIDILPPRSGALKPRQIPLLIKHGNVGNSFEIR